MSNSYITPITNKQLQFLSFQKVFPRENYHNNQKHNFYIYCYLNPFITVNKKIIIMGETYNFGYEPIYIGKASTNHGYRHNQHIAEFLHGKDSEEPSSNIGNDIKRQTFFFIDKQLKENNDPNLPSNWEEYQKQWIIILKSFDTAEQLIHAEKEFIKNIGTIAKQTGPLTNAILG
jgi:hypothetical protein